MTMPRRDNKDIDMDEGIQAVILDVVERAPQWIRHDLEARDARIRARAEEALAAMIGNALKAETAEPVATPES
jgi:hypothetical protein